MAPQPQDNPFHNLTYDDFRRLAADESLNQYEKIGFPASYRKGFACPIFEDIRRKLTLLERRDQVVVDIGPGCSELPHLLIDLCRANNHQLVLIDSPEMLAQLPEDSFIRKVPGFYPRDCEELFTEYRHRVGVILTYSVVQYVFAEANPFTFIDRSMGLLADGGQMLIGDIPNSAMRNRFFESEAGERLHKEFAGADAPLPIEDNLPERGVIDDGVLLGIVTRYRAAGLHAFIMPQAENLPMANRREDILIVKP
jgi:hypothetical protein